MSDNENMRIETVSEHIARDMREGTFPRQSERQMVPVEPDPYPALGAAAMRTAARDVCIKFAKNYRRYAATPYSHAENVALDLSRAVVAEALTKAINAIPLPDEAALTKDAMKLPKIKALVEALEGWMQLAANAEMVSGVCCCGDNMEGHQSAMDCGHNPVDMADAYASDRIKETKAALAALKGEQE